MYAGEKFLRCQGVQEEEEDGAGDDAAAAWQLTIKLTSLSLSVCPARTLHISYFVVVVVVVR